MDFLQVAALCRNVALLVARFNGGGRAKERHIALHRSRQRHLKWRINEDAIVPAVAEFWPQEEDAIHDKNCICGRYLLITRQRGSSAIVEDCAAIAPGASRSQWQEQRRAHRRISEGIQIVAIGRIGAMPVAVRAWPVKAIYR